MLAAAFSGKAEQRDDGFGIDQDASALRGGDGDVGELHRRRIDDDGAIGERHEAFVPQRLILERHDKDTRYKPGARVGSNAVQRGANRLGGAVDGSPDAAIGVARAYHQRREIERLARDRCGFHLGDAFRAAPLVIQGCVFREE